MYRNGVKYCPEIAQIMNRSGLSWLPSVDHRTITGVQLLTSPSINGNTSGPTVNLQHRYCGQKVNRVKEGPR